MINLEEAAYGYGSANLLSDMSLRLVPGSFHFLTGPSGAGKTTLLKLCYADLTATAGTVSLFGQDTAAGTTPTWPLASSNVGRALCNSVPKD